MFKVNKNIITLLNIFRTTGYSKVLIIDFKLSLESLYNFIYEINHIKHKNID
jgi:hypothetical protein